MQAFVMVFCTCPDTHSAQLAEAVVKQRLAACVNIAQNLRSVYRWQGKVTHDQEDLLMIKTGQDKFELLSSFITAHHPYDCPEVIALPLTAGEPNYLIWLSEQLQGE